MNQLQVIDKGVKGKALRNIYERLHKMGATKTDMVSVIRLANHIINNYTKLPPITNMYKKRLFQAAFDVCKPHFDNIPNARMKVKLNNPSDFLIETKSPPILYGKWIIIYYLYYELGLNSSEIALVFDITVNNVQHKLKASHSFIVAKKDNEIKKLYSKFITLMKL